MTNMDLLQYIGEVDDRYILESRKRPKIVPKPKAKKWPMALVACAMLAVLCGTGLLVLRERQYGAEHGQEPAVQSTRYPHPAETSTPTKSISAYGVALLAQAEYPEAIGYEDYEAQSQVWTENQVTEDTHYALKAFAYSTAAKVLANDTQSGCYSPLSLYQALSMLASGAEGQTQAELLSLLGQPDQETLQDQAGKLYRVNHADNEADILKIANSLWLDETAADGTKVDYKEDWVLSTAANYYADVYQTEFSDPDAGGALGAWIAEKTGGFLRPSAADLALPEDTVMAIVNTLWYRGQWQDRFDSDRTEEGDFTTENGETVRTEFMHRTELDGYFVQGDGYTRAELGLSQGHMTVILPDAGTAVDDLLTEEQLWDMFENNDYYQSAEVRWSVPKFETNATYDLEKSLKSLGVFAAFTDTADFSRISDTPLVLTKVQQGTHIAIDEEGVEAAAYTELAVAAGAAAPDEDPPVIEMNLDRPFLYLITANDGSPLFLGVVRNLPEIG